MNACLGKISTISTAGQTPAHCQPSDLAINYYSNQFLQAICAIWLDRIQKLSARMFIQQLLKSVLITTSLLSRHQLFSEAEEHTKPTQQLIVPFKYDIKYTPPISISSVGKLELIITTIYMYTFLNIYNFGHLNQA